MCHILREVYDPIIMYNQWLHTYLSELQVYMDVVYVHLNELQVYMDEVGPTGALWAGGALGSFPSL